MHGGEPRRIFAHFFDGSPLLLIPQTHLPHVFRSTTTNEVGRCAGANLQRKDISLTLSFGHLELFILDVRMYPRTRTAVVPPPPSLRPSFLLTAAAAEPPLHPLPSFFQPVDSPFSLFLSLSLLEEEEEEAPAAPPQPRSIGMRRGGEGKDKEARRPTQLTLPFSPPPPPLWHETLPRPFRFPIAFLPHFPLHLHRAIYEGTERVFDYFLGGKRNRVVKFEKNTGCRHYRVQKTAREEGQK